MKNFYDILGVSKTATDDEIKKAYRKLSSKHHPDKHVNSTLEERSRNEKIFQEITEAYTTLSDPRRRSEYNNGSPRHQQQQSQSEIDEILRMMRQAAFQAQHFANTPEIAVRIPIREAFKGASYPIQINGKTDTLKFPPGVPDSVRLLLKTDGGIEINCSISLECPSKFKITPAHQAQQEVRDNRLTGIIQTGTIETLVEIDAIDIMVGSYIDVEDITGTKFSVRVPSGFDPRMRLRVKGAGYYNWDATVGSPSKERGDMYVKLRPIFKAPREMDKAKIELLQKLSELSDKS